MKNSNGESNRQQTAMLYTRVSSDERAERGYSLRAQEERLRQYCTLNGITIVHHFEDDASGWTFDRPAFSELLTHLTENVGEANLLLFVKWDRLSLNVGEMFSVIGQLKELGVNVQAVEQPVDVTIPENKLMLAFYCSYPNVMIA